MAKVTDVSYALTVTAATSSNVTAPKPGTLQLHMRLGLESDEVTTGAGAGGDCQKAPSKVDMAMTMPQFYTLLSTLEEARIALNGANAEQ
jgi:hypothetical protein